MTHDYNMDAHMDAQGGMGAYNPPAPLPAPAGEAGLHNRHSFVSSGITAGNTGIALCDVCGASQRLFIHKDALIAELREALITLRKWMGPSGLTEEIDAAMSKADAVLEKTNGK